MHAQPTKTECYPYCRAGKHTEWLISVSEFLNTTLKK